ncbi:hypothetical protein VKT23_011019 [Stygiomarasmius scandens]|uniref:Uncharacterized protein n=1 Tax=Marasmiellus scandens TaxID=2682957 RepID=A0ABR1JET8_9AGAR
MTQRGTEERNQSAVVNMRRTLVVDPKKYRMFFAPRRSVQLHFADVHVTHEEMSYQGLPLKPTFLIFGKEVSKDGFDVRAQLTTLYKPSNLDRIAKEETMTLK